MHDGADSSRNPPYMVNNRWEGHQRFVGHTTSNCNLNGQDENSTFLTVSPLPLVFMLIVIYQLRYQLNNNV